MTPQAQKFVEELRKQSGVKAPDCPACGGHLDQDSGECTDCGTEFEKAARR